MSAVATPSTPATDIKLQIMRTYKATSQAIFDAWTKPELLMEWFFCGPMYPVETAADPRLGGSYRIVVEGPSHDDPAVCQRSTAHGVYTAFEPYTLLRFTWNISWRPEEKSQVTIALKPVDDGTQLLLTHELFLTEASRDGHERGWNSCLDHLGKYLA